MKRNFDSLFFSFFSVIVVLFLEFSTLSAENSFIGKVVSSKANHYHVIDKLGQGVFGKVYSVKDAYGTLFALKYYRNSNVLPGIFDLYGKPEREFQLGRFFDHPNIVKSFELFDLYLILEYVEGSTLGDLARNFLSKEEAIQASMQLVDALLYALDLQYIFFDMNNKNIMLDKEKNVKIVDVVSFISFNELDNFYFDRKELKVDPRRFEPILVKNFDKITSMCNQLFDKSLLSKVERLEKKKAFKNLAWNCEEDVREGKGIHLEYYLIQLRQLLMSFI